MLAVKDFYAESAWGLKFGAYGKDYTIVPNRHIGQDIARTGDVPALLAGRVVRRVKTATMAWGIVTDIGAGLFLSYWHLADDNLPAVGAVLAQGDRVGRIAKGPKTLPQSNPEFPGLAWYGQHCHIVVGTNIGSAYLFVPGHRTLDAFRDPLTFIRQVLAGTASDGAKPFPVEPKEWDEMATKEEIKAAVREVLAEPTVAHGSAYTIVNMFDDRGIYIVSNITGRRAHILSVPHVQMLQRHKTDDALLNFAEQDICRGYITAVNPPAGATVDTDALAAKLAEIDEAADAAVVKQAVKDAIAETTFKVSAS